MQLHQTAHELVQSRFKYLQGWRFHIPSKQSLPMFVISSYLMGISHIAAGDLATRHCRAPSKVWIHHLCRFLKKRASSGRYASLALESDMLEQNQTAIQRMVDDLIIFHTDSSGSHINTYVLIQLLPRKPQSKSKCSVIFCLALCITRLTQLKEGRWQNRYPNYSVIGMERIF